MRTQITRSSFNTFEWITSRCGTGGAMSWAIQVMEIMEIKESSKKLLMARRDILTSRRQKIPAFHQQLTLQKRERAKPFQIIGISMTVFDFPVRFRWMSVRNRTMFLSLSRSRPFTRKPRTQCFYERAGEGSLQSSELFCVSQDPGSKRWNCPFSFQFCDACRLLPKSHRMFNPAKLVASARLRPVGRCGVYRPE